MSFMRSDFRSWPSPPLRAVAIALALLLALSACDALGGSGSPTPDPSNGPAATPRPTPLASPPAGAVILEARDRQYSLATIEGVANVPTIIYFTNNDDQNHNVTIYRNAAKDMELFRGEVFVGPGVTVVYEVDPLPAGQYYFADLVTPSMHGTFIVR